MKSVPLSIQWMLLILIIELGLFLRCSLRLALYNTSQILIYNNNA
jgi:hypothetical protein